MLKRLPAQCVIVLAFSLTSPLIKEQLAQQNKRLCSLTQYSQIILIHLIFSRRLPFHINFRCCCGLKGFSGRNERVTAAANMQLLFGERFT